MILAGDVGGTKTALALFEERGRGQAVVREAVLASHGYAVVFQDCRGRGNSQGEYVKYLSDGRDGYDCCAWIVKQSWSNGRIMGPAAA